MRKVNLEVSNRLSTIRLKKYLARKEKNKFFRGQNAHIKKIESFLIERDRSLIEHKSFDLHSFLVKKEFINIFDKPEFHILIPKDFTFEESNYYSTIEILSKICISLILSTNENINIDFSNCTKIDSNTLFILEILGRNYVEFIEKLDSKLRILKIKPQVKVTRSKESNVNTYLLLSALTFITEDELKESKINTISCLGVLTGTKSQKHYRENKKGKTATKIIRYINECIKEHNFELEIEAKNRIEGVISEILNNGEDHGIMNTWYMTANYLSIQHTEGELIGELNLVFFNFGLSIFEGFEETKEKNHENYNELQQLYDFICSKYPKHKFTKENLFTLYALQEGNSRLKFEQESRGTGTMKFINSFLEFGDFENKEKNYMPKLSIISGSTHLVCDNKYKPFQRDRVNYLSLNAENDLSILPAESHLKALKKPFPGTLLSVKIYLNEEHFNQKIS